MPNKGLVYATLLTLSLSILAQTTTSSSTTITKLYCSWQSLITVYKGSNTFYAACSLGALQSLPSGQYSITCNITYTNPTVCNTTQNVSNTLISNLTERCTTISGINSNNYCLLFSACQAQGGNCNTAPVTTPATCQQFTITNTYTNTWKTVGAFFYIPPKNLRIELLSPPVVNCKATGPL